MPPSSSNATAGAHAGAHSLLMALETQEIKRPYLGVALSHFCSTHDSQSERAASSSTTLMVSVLVGVDVGVFSSGQEE